MKDTVRHLLYLSLTGCMLSSCVYVTQSVPDMPYEGSAGRTAYPDTWRTYQPAGINHTPAATPAPTIPEPAVNTSPAAPLDLTKPILPAAPKPTAPAAAKPAAPATPKPAPAATTAKPTPALQPIVTKAAAPQPAAATQTPADMSQITNTGPIPVATRVPGDPTRVYNPLNPSKTIRVVDKNGNPYPSGKELKVRGTNFHFYVP